MRFKLVLLTYLCASFFLNTPVNAGVGFDDDIDLSLILGDGFKSEKKLAKEAQEAQKEKNKQKKEKQEEASSEEKPTLDFGNKQPSPSQQEISSAANLLSKVKKGLPFSPDEMEAWIVNTKDINNCYENGQTMLLYVVARYTDIQSIRMLIENGADLQTHCNPRYEALFVAAINNPSATVTETLLNNGANLIDRDIEQNTALMLAATFNRSSKVLDTLLDYGLKTNATNKYGYDALMLAAYENGRIPILQTLIDNGSDVNFRDKEGHTPLMAAALRGRDEAMQYLIKRGADFNAKDNNGVSVLDYYNKRHYLKTLNFDDANLMTPSQHLEKQFEFVAENHYRYNNALKNSLYSENPDAEGEIALENLADVDVKDDNGCTPLLAATVNNNSLSVIEKLVTAKANVNASCLGGKTPLMILAEQTDHRYNPDEQLKKAQYLLNHKADPNLQDKNGDTALIYAVKNHADKAFIGSLVSAGADMNLANNDKQTPLWVAILNNEPAETVKMLIEHGANPNQPDVRGETPLWYLLRTDGNTELSCVLIRGGADVEKPNAAGDLPLWYAFNRNVDEKLLETIIAHQSNLNIKNENGDTPLLYAVKNDYPASIVKLLLTKKADPSIADKNGYTIYDILQSNQYYDETMKKRNRSRVLNAW